MLLCRNAHFLPRVYAQDLTLGIPIVLSFFESVAQRLTSHRRRILIGALIGFGVFVFDIFVGGALPSAFLYVVLLLTWWLWLSVMLIGLFESSRSESDELAGLVMSFPGFRQYFLVILIIMAVAPVVWFATRYA